MHVSFLALLMIGSVLAMVISTVGAVMLGKGPSTLWTVVMFAGMVASYLTIGTLLLTLYYSTGKSYPILAFVPIGMTYAAVRAYKQSRAAAKSSK